MAPPYSGTELFQAGRSPGTWQTSHLYVGELRLRHAIHLIMVALTIAQPKSARNVRKRL